MGLVPDPFIFSDGCLLTRQQLSSSVQSILNGEGYSGSYSGHSFRTGAETTVAAQKVPYQNLRALVWRHVPDLYPDSS